MRSVRPRLLLPEYSKYPKVPATNGAYEFGSKRNAGNRDIHTDEPAGRSSSAWRSPRVTAVLIKGPLSVRSTCYVSTHQHVRGVKNSAFDSFKLHDLNGLFAVRNWPTACTLQAWKWIELAGSAGLSEVRIEREGIEERGHDEEHCQ